MLEKGGVDILLLDINMPRLNGIDACSMWRQIEGGRQHLPIIGVTADATSETEMRCQNAGMDLRITKPVDAKLLLASIEHFCGNNDSAPGEVAALIAEDPMEVVIPISRESRPESDAIDPVQLEYLMSIGDTAFLQSMIEGFLEDVGQTIPPLRMAVEDNDVAAFRFCAHAFKSSGNNMGAKRLADLCGRLEKVTEADFVDQRLVYLDRIETELQMAVASLKTKVTDAPRSTATIARSR